MYSTLPRRGHTQKRGFLTILTTLYEHESINGEEATLLTQRLRSTLCCARLGALVVMNSHVRRFMESTVIPVVIHKVLRSAVDEPPRFVCRVCGPKGPSRVLSIACIDERGG